MWWCAQLCIPATPGSKPQGDMIAYYRLALNKKRDLYTCAWNRSEPFLQHRSFLLKVSLFLHYCAAWRLFLGWKAILCLWTSLRLALCELKPGTCARNQTTMTLGIEHRFQSISFYQVWSGSEINVLKLNWLIQEWVLTGYRFDGKNQSENQNFFHAQIKSYRPADAFFFVYLRSDQSCSMPRRLTFSSGIVFRSVDSTPSSPSKMTGKEWKKQCFWQNKETHLKTETNDLLCFIIGWNERIQTEPVRKTNHDQWSSLSKQSET